MSRCNCENPDNLVRDDCPRCNLHIVLIYQQIINSRFSMTYQQEKIYMVVTRDFAYHRNFLDFLGLTEYRYHHLIYSIGRGGFRCFLWASKAHLDFKRMLRLILGEENTDAGN